MKTLRDFACFLRDCVRAALTGSRAYWLWVGLLGVLLGVGLYAYVHQLRVGLGATGMRDQVSWAFYIGNFTFLVGVADAAVLVVIPAYIYKWKPAREVVVFGLLLAIAAVSMAATFVLVDIGHPERLWHLFPLLGSLNLPHSLLAWDVVALNSYLLLNIVIVLYGLFSLWKGKVPGRGVFLTMILVSIPVAIAVHTVTAFLYNGLASRPFWNSSILAPRFIASAFCSGPAVLLVLLQILRRVTKFDVQNQVLWKLAELMAYAMGFNLFLLAAEVFKEFYSGTEHSRHIYYMFTGLDGHNAIVPYIWIAVICSVAAFFILLIPRLRMHPVLLNVGCALTFVGVYIEKGIGLVIPGLTPDALGEIYEYVPTLTELGVTGGIFGMGGLIFTFGVKASLPLLEKFRGDGPGGGPAGGLPATGSAHPKP